MSALVFVEQDEGLVRKLSLEAVSYASHLDGDTHVVVFGSLGDGQMDLIGKAGAKKVHHVTEEKFAQVDLMAYSSAIAELMTKTGASVLVMAKSSLGDPISARVSVKIGAALVSNISELPENTDGFQVKRSIYTGKALAITEIKGEKSVLTIRKNAVEIKEDGQPAAIEEFSPTVNEGDFKVNITSREKTTGEVLLPEAEIVVSGGRGLKGPENWGMIEELARSLGAATGCSKPVSDMDWRPHREHVGQTGIKVSPSLYVAIGISGAIQHLAGVNSSKYILVINKDADAPFFKAADYGVVGDAFQIVPKLTEAVNAQKG